MKFITRFKRLTFWNKLGVLGATCSILGFTGWLLYIALAPKLQHEREALEAESRPVLSRLFKNLPTTKEVGLWIENHGGGVAYLTPYDIIINRDIKSKHSIQTLDDWRTALKRLGINDPWVTMGAIRG